MNEDFEKWAEESNMDVDRDQNRYISDETQYAWQIWRDSLKSMQSKLDAQDKELSALRKFAKAVIEGGYQNNNGYIFGLIDADGNPTKLLTGDK